MPATSSGPMIGLVHRLDPPISEKAALWPPAIMALNNLQLQALATILAQTGDSVAVGKWLSECEQQLLSGFTLKKRRLEWLGGRLSAKVSLLEILNGQGLCFCAEQLEILPDSTGRPHLASLGPALPEKLFLSISHSGGHAAALASPAGPCGLDIQQLSPALTGIKERFSTAGERRLLQSCPQFGQLDKIEQLALLWSAKEAFRKALHLTPLPAFLEMRLTARPRPASRAFQLNAAFNRDGQHRDFSVTAWLHNGMAVAVTFI